MSVQTKAVTARRKLNFESYDQILEEARKLAGGQTRQLGNWSLGQICRHLAIGMDHAVDGTPFRWPFVLRIAGPLIKKRLLTRPMSSGFKLPGRAAALLPEAVGTGEGVAMLETSIARLRKTSPRKPHGMFGPMTDSEWDQLQFRHAELHLSFVELARRSGATCFVWHADGGFAFFMPACFSVRQAAISIAGHGFDDFAVFPSILGTFLHAFYNPRTGP